MTNDNDLIRRGDAVKSVTDTAIKWGVTGEPAILVAAKEAIRAIPAVSTDSPVTDYLRARGFEVTQVHVSHGVSDLANASAPPADVAGVVPDEAAQSDKKAPDYARAMMFHSDRADQYMAERDAAIARIAAMEAEREKDHAEINIKADFIEATINQLAAMEEDLAAAVARAEKAEARVVELENNDAMEWQPIETAKQGRAIVFDEKIGLIADAYLFSNDGRASYGYYGNTAYNVTHWMPLPKPPRAALEGRDA